MKPRVKGFVICIDNQEYPASLERRKIYFQIEDAKAGVLDLIRVVDESGEDYLYPQSMFIGVELKADVKEAVLRVS